MRTAPVVKDICLVGGGHSHALVLRRWAMKPIAGIRLTLVSSAVQTPYSGMLPGLIAGHYSYEDIHIDLLRLCRWANVRFIEETVVALDLETRQVKFENRPPLGFDVLSLDTGSTPDLSVPGSFEHVTPVKPVSEFHARWQAIEQRLGDSHDSRVSIGVVGSGAGGFELITAMRYRLRHSSARFLWFLRGEDAISGRPARVGQLAITAATSAGIEVVRGYDVASVSAGRLLATDGRVAELDEIIWCTAATGPEWPQAADLSTDERGFVATNACLQSISHPFVFATGDIGTQIHTPSDKAGVFAVRQAKVLFENLRRLLLHEPLKEYSPQKDFLSLMASGTQHAIASRGPVVVQGAWVWRWKDHIDQSFMDKFRYLPERHMNAALARLPNALLPTDTGLANEASRTPLNDGSRPIAGKAGLSVGMRCRGCGAKVGNDVLQRVLYELSQSLSTHDNGTAWSPAGDAAVVSLPTRQLVQSVDQINAIVDDPWLLGRISTLHAISDVLTLNARVHSAQVLLTLPESTEQIVERDLRLMMLGIKSALEEESCALIGGHTSQGDDMAIGLVINATLESEQSDGLVQSPIIAQDADTALILTKAIGIGTLFAALTKNRASGTDISAATSSMLQSNRTASEILRQHESLAMTDVTGFGLLGHLDNLLTGLSRTAGVAQNEPGLGARLCLQQIPLLSGAQQLSQQGIRSSLFEQNSRVFERVSFDSECNPSVISLLADPQTSGGLLALVPAASASACIEALIVAGYEAASVIGAVEYTGSVRVTA